ncbi:hypothetical protein RB195_020332 [Necator americanus]|uniref:G-protein coupled receptors family 2 profile 2 domain-containing protein n=1 Tax=Necator americanus TaxID=51031 RepID=A0ABR1CJP0_NECAM
MLPLRPISDRILLESFISSLTKHENIFVLSKRNKTIQKFNPEKYTEMSPSLFYLLLILLLCTFSTVCCLNYTIFYKLYSSPPSSATITVTSQQQSVVNLIRYDIQYPDVQRPIVFVDGQMCDTECVSDLFRGDSSLLTFANDSDNLIRYYQTYMNTTLFYYRDCYQPMDLVKCRYRRGSNYELCVCNDYVKTCTYDALLSWNEIWCANNTFLTSTTKEAITVASGSTHHPTITSRSNDGENILLYSIFYSKTREMWSEIAMGVNISITYHNEENVTAKFYVLKYDEMDEFDFLVNSKICRNQCTEQMPPAKDPVPFTIMLGVSAYNKNVSNGIDYENNIDMLRWFTDDIMFRYRGCGQKMRSDIQCRSRSNLPVCLCNGNREDCSANAGMAIAPQCNDDSGSTIRTSSATMPTNSSSPTATTTPYETSPTTTTYWITSTAPNTTTSEEPTSTGTTSISPSTSFSTQTSTTSAPASNTTSATMTTSGTKSLKELSEGGVDLRNVSKVLNETLQYAEERTGLTADQIQDITTILQKSANLSGIQAEDSQKVLLNMDCILSADASQINASNSSETLLSMLPTLVINTNASGFDFLNGENLGFTSQMLDCSSIVDTNGLIDLGKTFEIINGSTNSGEDPPSHMYMTIYRNRKLFVGPKQYNSYKAKSTLAQRSLRVINDIQFQEDSPQNPEELQSLPPLCSRQIALPNDSPVMSGTVLNNEEKITELFSQRTMAVLKFNITNVLRPLHGHFRVTWWDTDIQEWSTDNQCETSIDEDTIVARCDHLTDFTLIVDASLNDPNVCDRALIDLGYVVNSLSIISLIFLSFVNLCAYTSTAVGNRILRYLRGYAPPQKDFVSLSHKISLLFFYLIFTFFTNQNVSGKACDVLASIAYILFISSELLTIFQALRLTTVFGVVGPYLKALISPLSALTVSLLVPFITSVLLLTLTNFFHRGDCFCWVRPDYIVYAVIVPVSFTIANAFFCTVVVCRRFFGRRRMLSKAVRYRDNRIISKIVAVLLMQVPLGTPWVLQFFTLYSPTATIWHYIFTIFIGSQGTFLAILFFYKRRQSLASYRRSHASRSGNTNTKEGFSSVAKTTGDEEHKQSS